MRIGSGLDIHRLIEDAQRPLMLGGVEIPGPLALEGHSDADALLHALTDAILGALGLGDIGEYFPNTDPEWKNAPSKLFLLHAMERMETAGYALANVDCTVLCERPKLQPFKAPIRRSLATLLKLPLDRIGLKATTAERLGALGRGEGLLAHAIVLLDAKPEPPTRQLAVVKAETVALQELVKEDAASRPDPVKSRKKREVVRAEALSSEGGMVLRAYTDGASRGNPGPSSIGVVLQDEQGQTLHEVKHAIGTATNNEAEYQAVIYAVRAAAALAPRRLDIYADSELVVKQLNGEYKVKNERLQKLNAQLRVAMQEIPEVTFTHVRREQNTRADALANEALDAR